MVPFELIANKTVKNSGGLYPENNSDYFQNLITSLFVQALYNITNYVGGLIYCFSI